MSQDSSQSMVAQLGLWIGPLFGLLIYWIAPETQDAASDGLSPAGRIVAGVGAWMAVWWLSEALPLAATALVPVAVLPLLTAGEISVRTAAAAYAHEMVLLFLGGFILGRAIEHVDLHRRVALTAIRFAGTRPHQLIAAFMWTGAFLSMWVSNTATAVMMLPIALSVIQLVQPTDREQATNKSVFATALLLGVAYSTSIGGIGTLIGTPPNAQLAGYISSNFDFEISFATWMLVGLPLVLILLPVTWLVLTRVAFRVPNEPLSDADQTLKTALSALGPPTGAEIRVGIVFLLTALAWISRQWLTGLTLGEDWQPLSGLSDTGIALVAGVAVFVLPGEKGQRLMTWEQMRTIPWGVLLLFGGGLSLAKAAQATGLANFVGSTVAGWEGLSPIILIAVITLVIVLLTEMTSNTATAAAFLPIIGGAAQGLDIAPLQMLVPATLAASCAFMMPVATPPNAVVFGSGAVTIRQMCWAGIWLNSFAWITLIAVSYWLVPRLF